MTFNEIIAEAKAESDRLDIEVCGGAKGSNDWEAEERAEKALRIEAYRAQVVDTEHEGTQPPEGGFRYIS